MENRGKFHSTKLLLVFFFAADQFIAHAAKLHCYILRLTFHRFGQIDLFEFTRPPVVVCSHVPKLTI